MERIGIAGLGTMGLGIAQLYAQAGFRVLATDAQPAARDSAVARIRAALEPRVAAGKLAPEALEAMLANISVAAAPAGIARADLVIEAVVEDLAVKRRLLAGIEEAAGPETVLATNTSALPVAALAEGLRRPAMLVGLHFFNPAPVMRLVELVAHPGSAPAALARARALTERAGKEVIGCADRPGFIVNRCARPYYGEALAMLEEGRSPGDIDAAMLAAGYRMGPFALIDLIGADVNLAATEGLSRGMGGHPRYHVFAALRAQVARGALGRKSGQGFLFPGAPGPAPADATAIRLRIEATLANEAASLLAEGAASEGAIDLALKLGLNFPRGPIESARILGLDAVRAELARLAAAAPPALRGRYEVSPALAALA
ncbi:MAG: 3-hydroxybutyryl-CoA dehydrogenase [Proteobacteria bacterium]|nr:3-hydroxybutyryl-CoA dehydrogenase [Pseudomonadota bacterium]MBS0573686.1 3-hydroxybutyryl-CoA dehydrogenase [Pseudomonadota bacterium]